MSERSKLIPVINTENTSRRADVIFVHGINADPQKTWMADNKLEGFPEESWLYWLGDDIPDVAVWTLGYPASAFAWQGFTMELEERAENITNLLLTYPGLDNNRPIIFVTHSMGGLLVKYILCRALSGDSTESNAKSLVERTKGIVFLSTPHTGANLANFIEFVAFLFTNPNVGELKRDEPKLLALNQDFCENFDQLDLQVRVFYEKNPTPIRKGIVGNLIRKIVVDEDSATFDRDKMPNVPMTPIDANHTSICWPIESYQLRQRDQLYSNIFQFIQKCLVIPPNPLKNTPVTMSVPTPSQKLRLQEKLIDLEEERNASNSQYRSAIDDAQRIRLQRKLDDLDKEIDDLKRQLNDM